LEHAVVPIGVDADCAYVVHGGSPSVAECYVLEVMAIVLKPMLATLSDGA